jgi:putative endonuclease
MSQQMGFAAETYAHDYLVLQGLTLLSSNYHCKMGEIDLIMRDKTHLIFIEVRARISNAFGGALASVTYAKRKKLYKAALHYLSANHLHEKFPIRFDVVAIDGKTQQITWIKNAFADEFQ